MTKSNKELIEEFLKTNKIEKIPSIKSNKLTLSVGKTKYITTDLMSLGDAIDMYGEKQARKARKKTPDLSNIDKNLIPESLHGIMNLYKDDINHNNKESEE